MAGRPTELTPEIQETLCNALRAGNHINWACDFVGISYQTFREWMRRGDGTDVRPGNELYANFANAIRRARSEAAITSMAQIRKAAQGGQKIKEVKRKLPDGTVETEVVYSKADYRAATWFIEKSYPKEYGVQRQELDVNIKGMDDAELRDFIKSRIRGDSGGAQ